MPWSGPVASAAAYRSHSLTDSRPSHHQLQQQHGLLSSHVPCTVGHTPSTFRSLHQASDHRPPKTKGNPIITRYPPPPGYRGPVQSQGPCGVNSWSYPQYGYPQAASMHPVNSGQIHQGVRTQLFHAQPQNWHWPQQFHASNQPYTQGQLHSASTSNFVGYSQLCATVNPNQGDRNRPSTWPMASTQPQEMLSNPCTYPFVQPQNIVSRPNAEVTSTHVLPHLATCQSAKNSSRPAIGTLEGQSNEKPDLFLALDDWDFDFEGAIWPKSNEPIDPDLSLGVIIWHPGKQVTRALPATFREAEAQALRPAPEKLGNGESVSMFFTNENSHEAFLDVRQTDYWETIRDDPIFVTFESSTACQNLVSLDECIALRDRPDEFTERLVQDNDEVIHDAAWNVMDHLERVLSVANVHQPPTVNQHGALMPRQEDILAALGVTGDPKPPPTDSLSPLLATIQSTCPESQSKILVHNTLLAPCSWSSSQEIQPYIVTKHTACSTVLPQVHGSTHTGSSILPISPSTRPGGNNSWSQPVFADDEPVAITRSPARSEGSDGMMIGSNFRPQRSSSSIQRLDTAELSLRRSDSSFSRKRSYENADYEDETLQQHIDHAKRKRRGQTDAAYSRR